jgi:hypothetical protein
LIVRVQKSLDLSAESQIILAYPVKKGWTLFRRKAYRFT